MSALTAAILADFTPDDLAVLAERLRPFLESAEPAPVDRWLTTREAAGHLGISVHALHKLTAARAIAFEQSAPGAKCWFRQRDLDAYRRGEGR
jgi:hypothetical protein